MKSINKIYVYCRWSYKYPSDNWCLIGIFVWWQSPEYYEYRICLFGFELRIGINRLLKNYKNHDTPFN